MNPPESSVRLSANDSTWPEGESDGADEQGVGDQVIPAQLLVKNEESKYCEDDQRDALLHDLQLRQAEVVRADAIRRHLKNVLEERDRPARHNRQPKRSVPVFEMSVPRHRHESI